jgi:hypothetical protein
MKLSHTSLPSRAARLYFTEWTLTAASTIATAQAASRTKPAPVPNGSDLHDPQNPDGIGIGLSDELAVTLCN